MAKHHDKSKKTTTHRDTQPSNKPDWKRDRYEQRTLKVTARRQITGGF